MRASKHDLEMAQTLYRERFYDGCAFHAQQSAEKALKALLHALEQLPWGHSCFVLLQQVGELLPNEAISSALIDAAHRLDQHYLPSRYPDALPEGIPAEQYDRELATLSLTDAEMVIRFVEEHLP